MRERTALRRDQPRASCQRLSCGPLPRCRTTRASPRLRFDTQVLARIDTAAKRLGISRTAWLHLAAGELLEAGDDPVLGKRDAGAARVGLAYR
jgi:hypothetical protein